MENEIRSVPYESSYLMHYGIKGQKWGVRRYQNTDGSWTAAGRARYSKSGGHASNVSYGGAKTKAIRKFAGNVGSDVGKAVRKAGRKTRAYAEAIDEVWGVRKGLNKAFENGVAGGYKAGRKIGEAVSSGSRKLAKKGRKVYNNAIDKLVSREMRKNAKAYSVNAFDMDNEGARLLRLANMKKNNPIKKRAALKAYNDNYRSLRRSIDVNNHAGLTFKKEHPGLYEWRKNQNRINRGWQKQQNQALRTARKHTKLYNSNHSKASRFTEAEMNRLKGSNWRKNDNNWGTGWNESRVEPSWTSKKLSLRKIERGKKESVGLYKYKNKNRGKKRLWR